MSRLALGNDDHPEAAQKHLDDARVLQAAERHCGAAYLAGYVVECAVKAVVLHDRSFDPATATTDPVKLADWHKQLKKRPYGHDIAGLLALAATVGGVGAPYFPALDRKDSVVAKWTEQLRYQRAGAVDAAMATSFVLWAELAMHSIVRMKLDGVL